MGSQEALWDGEETTAFDTDQKQDFSLPPLFTRQTHRPSGMSLLYIGSVAQKGEIKEANGSTNADRTDVEQLLSAPGQRQLFNTPGQLQALEKETALKNGSSKHLFNIYKTFIDRRGHCWETLCNYCPDDFDKDIYISWFRWFFAQKEENK